MTEQPATETQVEAAEFEADSDSPLVGIVSLLRAARHGDVIVVVPADMPLVEPAYLSRLLESISSNGQVGAVMGCCGGVGNARLIQPLPSVWRGGPGGRGSRLAERALSACVAGPHRLAAWNGVSCIGVDGWRDQLFSINHGIDLYPVLFFLDEDIATEIIDPGDRKDTRSIEIESEEALIELLGKILKSEKTRRIIDALLSQADYLEEPIPF